MLVLVVAACADPHVENLAAVRDKVCACKTASCAEQELGQISQAPIKSTPHMQDLARAIQDCYAKRLAAERPAADSQDDSADQLEPEPEAAAVSKPPAGKP